MIEEEALHFTLRALYANKSLLDVYFSLYLFFKQLLFLFRSNFINVYEKEVIINSEFIANELADHITMSVSHKVVSKFTNKG